MSFLSRPASVFNDMKCFRYILIIGFCCCNWLLSGQVPDSISNQPSPTPAGTPITDTIQTANIPADTLQPEKEKGFIGNLFSTEDYPNPKKALYLSLAIPGAGQVYNKRWWKLPFVYGGYTLMILAIDHNTSGYKTYRDAYIAELAGEEHAFSQTGLDANDLRQIRDGYDKNRQLSYIGLFALHIIQTAEAFVDCHLKTFDVSDDLSLRIRPDMGLTADNQSYVGIGFNFYFKNGN